MHLVARWTLRRGLAYCFKKTTTQALHEGQHYVLSYHFNVAPGFTFWLPTLRAARAPDFIPRRETQHHEGGTQYFKMDRTCNVEVGVYWWGIQQFHPVGWRNGTMALFRIGPV